MLKEFLENHELASWIVAFACSFAISWSVVWLILHPRSRWDRLDIPNERSSHHQPTPRGGGLAVVLAAGSLGAAIILITDSASAFFWPAVAATLMIVVSYADDVRQLGAWLRLAAHITAAMVLLSGDLVVRKLRLPGLEIALTDPVAQIFTGLMIVWLINLHNFMDGMDGLCAGMSIIGFLTLALLAHMNDGSVVTIVCLGVAGAAAGFLYFNFPPARIFMGDVGSATIGFLVAVIAIWCNRKQVIPLWQTMLIFSPFIVDATLTLFWRISHRQMIWLGHRDHCYQRLLTLGWSSRRVLMAEYAVMLGCAVSALLCEWLPTGAQIAVLVAWFLFYVMAFRAVHIATPRAP